MSWIVCATEMMGRTRTHVTRVREYYMFVPRSEAWLWPARREVHYWPRLCLCMYMYIYTFRYTTVEGERDTPDRRRKVGGGREGKATTEVKYVCRHTNTSTHTNTGALSLGLFIKALNNFFFNHIYVLNLSKIFYTRIRSF